MYTWSTRTVQCWSGRALFSCKCHYTYVFFYHCYDKWSCLFCAGHNLYQVACFPHLLCCNYLELISFEYSSVSLTVIFRNCLRYYFLRAHLSLTAYVRFQILTSIVLPHDILRAAARAAAAIGLLLSVQHTQVLYRNS